MYTVGEVSLPVTYRLVTKTELYIDKQGKRKRRSCVTKNEHFRTIAKLCAQPDSLPLNDVSYVKLKLDKEFIMALKTNRFANKTNSWSDFTDCQLDCQKTQ